MVTLVPVGDAINPPQTAQVMALPRNVEIEMVPKYSSMNICEAWTLFLTKPAVIFILLGMYKSRITTLKLSRQFPRQR